MMSATALNKIYAKLPARDVERARAFYADKLDLTPFDSLLMATVACSTSITKRTKASTSSKAS
jgi:predicted enzyme related to lactoylglutathione lyase